MRTRFSVAALLLCAPVLALALGSVAANGSSSAGQATASGGRTVVIKGFSYHPPKLVVHRGTKVVFSNSDRTAHTATRRGSFSTGRIRSGHAVAVKFNHRGTYGYFCTIHPGMHGKIVVVR
jgi:plastocyanin